MDKFIFALILGCLFCVSNGTPLIDPFERNAETKADTFDESYRLPSTVWPSEYKILLNNINFSTFTFSGTVDIKVEVTTATDTVIMHSNRLNISSYSLKNEAGIDIPITHELDAPLHFLKFKKTEGGLFTVGKYEIYIEFDAIIQDDMSGFYRNWYKEGDTTIWMGSTQFQPVYARKAFPCFDEPIFKSVFHLSIDCPADHTCVANMPESDKAGSVVNFEPTPRMSTYLIAFMVSKFEESAVNAVNPNTTIWARPAVRGSGDYAAKTSDVITNALGNYLQVDYYSHHVKMDHAAIPDFSAGAMENWGLITYREAYLLFEQGSTSVRYKQQIATILAHEIAHMWFGNLVTCNWWANTWLNEGFATFFQYFFSLDSENLGLEDQFVVTQLQAALSADTTINSAPMTNPNVNTPQQISGHFSTISYQKGGSVIRMIEHLIGKTNFQRGLNAYLNARRYENSVPDDLFSALGDNADLTEYGLTVKQVMESWTSQAGYPLIQADVNLQARTLTLTQKRFVKEGETPNDSWYYVPVTFTTSNNKEFDNLKPAFILDNTAKTVDIDVTDGWVILNKQQTGLYRVNYDRDNWYKLAEALKEKDAIHRYNKAQLVDDAMNLAREGQMDYSMMLDIINFLKDEKDYAPWQSAISGFNFLRLHFSKVLDLKYKFEYYLRSIVTELVVHLDSPAETHLQKMFKNNAMNLACAVREERCRFNAALMYDKFMKDEITINPDIREHVYCTGLRSGNGEEFDFLWNRYLTEDHASEKVLILGALGCTRNQSRVMDFLTYTLKPIEFGIRDQDRSSAFNSAISGNEENVITAIDFIDEHFDEVTALYGNPASLLSSIANRMTQQQLPRLESYISGTNKLTADQKASVERTIASAKDTIAWVESKSDEVIDWIDLNYNAAGTKIASISLMLVSLLALKLF